jgi:hypothetical protein
MERWKQVGIRVGPHLRYAFRYLKGDLDASFPGGAGLSIGYDLSSSVSMGDEFWLRFDGGYQAGAAEFGYRDLSAYVDFVPEAHFYAFERGAWVFTSGLGGAWLAGTYVDPASGGAETASVSGLGVALIVGGGLDLALHPDWNLEGLLRVRQGLHPMKATGELNGDSVTLDASMLGQVELELTISYTF